MALWGVGESSRRWESSGRKLGHWESGLEEDIGIPFCGSLPPNDHGLKPWTKIFLSWLSGLFCYRRKSWLASFSRESCLFRGEQCSFFFNSSPFLLPLQKERILIEKLNHLLLTQDPEFPERKSLLETLILSLKRLVNQSSVGSVIIQEWYRFTLKLSRVVCTVWLPYLFSEVLVCWLIWLSHFVNSWICTQLPT